MIIESKQLKLSVISCFAYFCRSVHAGLLALAVSDMVFCAILIPHAWIPVKRFIHYKQNFELYYRLYGDGIINTFIMISTWLTVTMAMSRYLGICKSLKISVFFVLKEKAKAV